MQVCDLPFAAERTGKKSLSQLRGIAGAQEGSLFSWVTDETARKDCLGDPAACAPAGSDWLALKKLRRPQGHTCHSRSPLHHCLCLPGEFLR